MADPVIRWAGSKRKLLPRLANYWLGDSPRYVEPFAGSACLFFHIEPQSAILGDINQELIHAYRILSDNLQGLWISLSRLSPGKRTYLRVRSQSPNELSSTARAARFFFLNRYCFNGIYRTNLKGQFNVPYGGDKTGSLPTYDEFKTCSELLTKASVRAGGFEKTLELVEKGDFVYLDPPFSVKARRVFRQYDSASFDDKKLKSLRSWLRNLDHGGAKFLVSYADSQEGRKLAKGYECHRVPVRRHIAGFTVSRRRAYELVISNFSPKSASESNS